MVRKGFTLLEILIVLVIIGIVVSAVSLKMVRHSNTPFVERSTLNLFRSQLLLAEQRASILSVTIGLSLNQQGYQFSEYTPAGSHAVWVTMNSKGLQPRRWSIGEKLQLATTFEPVPTALPKEYPATPQIIINSSGTVSVFTLYLNPDYTLAATQGNEIVLEAQKK